MPYVDAESVLRGWLATQFPSARVVTETPADLADVLPCIRITRFGGSDNGLGFDEASVDADVYDTTRDDARKLAEQVREAFVFALPGSQLGQAFALSSQTIMAPTWTPYDNTNLRRFTASYRIRLHSQGTFDGH